MTDTNQKQSIVATVEIDAYGLIHFTQEQFEETLAKAYMAGKNGDDMSIKVEAKERRNSHNMATFNVDGQSVEFRAAGK